MPHHIWLLQHFMHVCAMKVTTVSSYTMIIIYRMENLLSCHDRIYCTVLYVRSFACNGWLYMVIFKSWLICKHIYNSFQSVWSVHWLHRIVPQEEIDVFVLLCFSYFPALVQKWRWCDVRKSPEKNMSTQLSTWKLRHNLLWLIK